MTDSNRLVGRWLQDMTPAVVQDAVASLLAPHRERLVGETVIVVPDVHYPFHPSTGLVAHPTVVAALAAALQRAPGTEVVIGCRSAPVVSTEATVRALGYPRLADRLGVELLDLDEADTDARQLTVHDQSVEVDVPRPMAGATVVVVPTLRTDPDFGLALGMPTLATAMHRDIPSVEAIWGAATSCSPALTLLDASYTFVREPRASGFLLSSTDLITLDAAVAGAVDRSPTYLEATAVRDLHAVYPVEGISLEDATASLPAAGPSRSKPPGQFVRSAYRLYARLARDAIPPALLP